MNGKDIRKARRDLDMDQVDLAAKAGIAQSYLSAIENGKAVPSQAVLERIAAALGLKLIISLQPADAA